MEATHLNTLLEYGDRKRIAQDADVGISTVTRVLNGSKVKAEYVAKVVKAALAIIKKREATLKRVEISTQQLAQHHS